MDAAVLAARLILATVFTLAAAGKLADRAGTRQAIVDFGVPAALARPAAFLLPLSELLCAIGLIPAISARWAAMSVSFLLALFIGGIAVSIVRGRAITCSCFGQLRSAPVGWGTLMRNVALGALAIFIIWSPHAERSPMGGWTSVEARPSVALVASLASTGISAFALYVLFHVVRQNGRILGRL